MKKQKMKQLTLFDKPVTEYDVLWTAIHELKFSHDKVRKRLFQDIKHLEDELVKVRAENVREQFRTA